MSDPDPINVAALRAELRTADGRWRQIDLVAEAGSTNADLAAAARAGERPGAVLVTDFQSAGRGRLGRTWTAPAGTNVAMSVLVRPAVSPGRWTWVPLLTGLAVAAGLERAAGVTARLKWPNDVLVEERKVCGILVERVETPTGPACVIGMGINVHLHPDQLPVPTATSLAIVAAEFGAPVPTRTEVIAAVLTELGDRLARWEQTSGDEDLSAAYVAHSVTLGRPVRVLLGDGATVSGTAESIDVDGRLVLRTDAGRQVFGAGDVIHLRT